MLDSALPDDWPSLERGLRAALALASTSPQVSVTIGQLSCLVQGPCKLRHKAVDTAAGQCSWTASPDRGVSNQECCTTLAFTWMWQAGAQLLAGGLRRTLGAATAALERGKARGDEDDSAFAEVNSAFSAAIAVVKQSVGTLHEHHL